MRITKAEMVAIAVTMVVLISAGSFYLGRSTADPGISLNATAPEPSITLQEQVPEESAEISKEISLGETLSVQEFEASVYEDAEPIAETDSGLIDLNTATAEQLETLPKVGPVLAQRILAYRDEIGGFTSVDELKNVSGIGDKIFASIENLVEVVN